MHPMRKIGTFNGLFALEAVTAIFRHGWPDALERQVLLYFFVNMRYSDRAYDFAQVN